MREEKKHPISRCALLLGSFISSGKMSQKKKRFNSEKSKILKKSFRGMCTLETAKILGHDHRTVKHFVANTHVETKMFTF